MKKKIFICAFIIIYMLTFIPAFAEEYTGSSLYGRLTLKIPEVGSLSYAYTPYLRDSSGSLIPTEDLSLSLSELPDGVNFDSSKNTVTVYDTASVGDMFTITTSSDKYPDIQEKSYTVRLTDNMLVNSSFLDMPYMSGWDEKNSPSFQTDGSMLKIDFNANSGYTYILTQKDKLFFTENTLYEFSFEIKTTDSDNQSASSKAYSEIIASSAVVYLSNPNYSSWTKVTVPLRPSSDGDYIFSLVALSDENASVLIRNLSLKPASGTLPVSIKAAVPHAINIPYSGDVKIPITIHAYDLEDNITPATIYYEVSPKCNGISFAESEISISAEAEPGSYIVHAYAARYPEVSTDFKLNLTHSGITNGGFEDEGSESLWYSPGNGVYEITKESGNSYASFTPNSEIGVMYNNAYVSFSAAQSYVFEADLKRRFSDQEAYVTFIVEDNEDPDNLQLCAYFEIDTSWKNYKAVFTPEKDLSGRFIVAVNVPDGFDEQTVYLDNISVALAEIRAENVKVSGTPKRGNTLVGSFDFVNNFDGESASITNWALSDSINGPYRELSYSNVNELEVTEDMEGRYIIFEVTPISLTAGIVGETVKSSPILVPQKQSASHRPSSKPEKDDPEEVKPVKDKPTDITITELLPYDGQNSFSDCEGHWAEKIINSVYASGIISGYSDNLFKPDINITRAEFSSLVVKSLGLEAGLYSGKYADVSLQSWYAGIIQTMLNCSLIEGVTNDNFCPNAPITREDAALILVRAYKLIRSDVPYDELSFSDADKISDYARSAVSSAVALGIVKGNESGLFLPKSNATRAEATVMLSNFLNTLKND